MTIPLPALKKADALKRSNVGSSAFNNFMSGTNIKKQLERKMAH